MIAVIFGLVAVVLLVLMVVAFGMRSMNRRESNLPPERLEKLAKQAEDPSAKRPGRPAEETFFESFPEGFDAFQEPERATARLRPGGGKTGPRPAARPGGRPGPRSKQSSSRGRRGVDEWGDADDYDDDYWTRVREDDGAFGGTIAARVGASRPDVASPSSPEPQEKPAKKAKEEVDPNSATVQAPLPTRAPGKSGAPARGAGAPVTSAATDHTVAFSAPVPAPPSAAAPAAPVPVAPASDAPGAIGTPQPSSRNRRGSRPDPADPLGVADTGRAKPRRRPEPGAGDPGRPAGPGRPAEPRRRTGAGRPAEPGRAASARPEPARPDPLAAGPRPDPLATGPRPDPLAVRPDPLTTGPSLTAGVHPTGALAGDPLSSGPLPGGAAARDPLASRDPLATGGSRSGRAAVAGGPVSGAAAARNPAQPGPAARPSRSGSRSAGPLDSPRTPTGPFDAGRSSTGSYETPRASGSYGPGGDPLGVGPASPGGTGDFPASPPPDASSASSASSAGSWPAYQTTGAYDILDEPTPPSGSSKETWKAADYQLPGYEGYASPPAAATPSAPSYEVRPGWATIDDSDPLNGATPPSGTPGYDASRPARGDQPAGGQAQGPGGYEAGYPSSSGTTPPWPQPVQNTGGSWPSYGELYGTSANGPEDPTVQQGNPSRGGHRRPTDPDYPDYYR
ncbi:hypothetical protein Sme01_07460 [Sphaerisporangium melleum]|uniref:Uncharacterized protein n=1 Tax=Sphaerisporangium melleum TaxID=321316 RepID=A0A917VG10_9ACTN|nr:hypothetical protein [Sphaerisporangium melleum]GGK72969.1 hypothetical protein GCM10007964_14740 [Sphaerisporangium melleum]GII68270.1 hypothetical protein Sme01_07460 [Sphaerisporangium melleum]